jgi:hypothetical protein
LLERKPEKESKLDNEDGPIFTYICRNKFIAIDAKNFDDFIDFVERHLNMLKDWRRRGIMLDSDDGVQDDYARFYTHDPALAAELGFQEEEIEDE